MASKETSKGSLARKPIRTAWEESESEDPGSNTEAKVSPVRQYHFRYHFDGRKRPRNANHILDQAEEWLWERHTLIVLCFVLYQVVQIAFSEDNTDSVKNARRGTIAGCVAFLVVGALQFNDGPFMRPHPMVWRVVFGISILNMLAYTFLVFQTPEDGRAILHMIEPRMGVPLPEQTYAEDCRIYVPNHPSGNPFANVYEKMDIFIIGHSLGWFIKSLLLRDFWLLHITSVLFELLEYSLAFQLPNFAECWWDHWLLDALGCNALGIYLGMLACRFMSLRKYDWGKSIWSIPSYRGKLQRMAQQFTPMTFQKYEWDATRSLKRWIAISCLGVGLLFAELMSFYLKSVLWIPSNHPFNIIRLGILLSTGAVCVREVYDYVHDSRCKKVGQQTFVLIATLSLETMITIKYGRTMFSWEPEPRWLYFWISLIVLYVAFTLYSFLIKPLFEAKTANLGTDEGDLSSVSEGEEGAEDEGDGHEAGDEKRKGGKKDN